MQNPEELLALMGLRSKTGPAAGPMDVVRLVRRGIPTDVVQALLDSGRLSASELDQIVLPRKTLAHRRKLGALTPEQSDRLMRVTRLVAAAEETFGSQSKAATWLRRPTTALANQRPLDLMDTDEGGREVDALLGRINHGIAA